MQGFSGVGRGLEGGWSGEQGFGRFAEVHRGSVVFAGVSEVCRDLGRFLRIWWWSQRLLEVHRVSVRLGLQRFVGVHRSLMGEGDVGLITQHSARHL